jgi:hypothetical protein
VSRFKICTFELGDGSLTAEEQDRIRRAFKSEAERLRTVLFQIDFRQRRSSTQEHSGD